jgi:hypothetical protein
MSAAKRRASSLQWQAFSATYHQGSISDFIFFPQWRLEQGIFDGAAAVFDAFLGEKNKIYLVPK